MSTTPRIITALLAGIASLALTAAALFYFLPGALLDMKTIAFFLIEVVSFGLGSLAIDIARGATPQEALAELRQTIRF
ncbi:hypothetical protein JNJ66_01305 [Candidatus Saccharibacteria bacterium]|nr:hypothetical protein [Candidatus Saccharibacteria bacterium]